MAGVTFEAGRALKGAELRPLCSAEITAAGQQGLWPALAILSEPPIPQLAGGLLDQGLPVQPCWRQMQNAAKLTLSLLSRLLCFHKNGINYPGGSLTGRSINGAIPPILVKMASLLPGLQTGSTKTSTGDRWPWWPRDGRSPPGCKPLRSSLLKPDESGIFGLFPCCLEK